MARDMHTPALRMGVLRVNKAAKRRVLAAHAGCALPKGRRTRRRGTRIVCTHALLAVAAGFPCVLRVTVIRHVPLAPLLALAALAVISEHCCIGNVSQGVIVVGRADFSQEALVASAAGLLCRFALAVVCDLVFAPRLTTTVRHAGVESFALSLQAAFVHGGRARLGWPAAYRFVPKKRLSADYHPSRGSRRGTEPAPRWESLYDTDGNKLSTLTKYANSLSEMYP